MAQSHLKTFPVEIWVLILDYIYLILTVFKVHVPYA